MGRFLKIIWVLILFIPVICFLLQMVKWPIRPIKSNFAPVNLERSEGRLWPPVRLDGEPEVVKEAPKEKNATYSSKHGKYWYPAKIVVLRPGPKYFYTYPSNQGSSQAVDAISRLRNDR